MLSIVAFLALAVVVSAFIAAPIFRTNRVVDNSNHKQSTHKIRELLERKETVYGHIKDIEFDYETGKLSETDFAQLRQQYKDEAVAILKRIDQLQGKSVKARDALDKQRESTDKAKMSGIHFCWMCGTQADEKDKFCSNCGNDLTSKT